MARPAATTALLLTLTAATIYLLSFGLPVIRAEALSRAGDESLRTAKVGENVYPDRFAQSSNLYLQAARTFPGNPEYFMRAYHSYIYIQGMDPTTLRSTLDNAIAADPLHIRARLERARLEQRFAQEGDPAADLPRAIAEFTESLRLNPNDVMIRLEFAALLAQANKPTEAATQIDLALKYDSLLDLTEPKRLTLKKLAETQTKLTELQAQTPPTTQP